MSNNIVNQEVLVGFLDKIVQKRSIAVRVSDVQPLTGPFGVTVGTSFDKATKKFIVEKGEITAETRKIETHFTYESLEDFKNIYGERFEEMLAYYLSDDLIYQIDHDFMTMVKTRGALVKTAAFSGAEFNNALSEVALALLVLVNNEQAKLPLSDNRSTYSWAVVNNDVGSLISSSLNLELTDDEKKDPSASYIGTAAGVNYYIDFTHDNSATDAIVFGIKGSSYSRGSTIYSNYKSELISTTDANSGEGKIFLIDRTGIAINPLDKPYFDAGKSGFIGKINVDLSDLEIFKNL